MTKADVDRIADAVAQRMEGKTCSLGLTCTEAQEIKGFVQAFNSAKDTARKVIITVVIMATMGLLFLGFKTKIIG